MTYSHKLVAFAQQDIAETLVSYLVSEGIQAIYRAEQGEFSHCVYLLNQQQVEQATPLVREFLQQPGDRKYQQAAWQHGQASSNSAPWLRLPSIKQLFDTPVTSVVLLLCLVVFGLSNIGFTESLFSWLRIVAPGESALNYQFWRLLSPAFFHFSTMHLVFNLLWWWLLGRQIEQKFGSSALLLLLLFTGLISNLAQYAVSGANFGGLSGVVYGLFGFVWWIGWLRPQWGLGLPRNLIGFLLIWLLVGYADILWVKMANTAHTVGLISGCLGAFALVKFSRFTPGRDT